MKSLKAEIELKLTHDLPSNEARDVERFAEAMRQLHRKELGFFPLQAYFLARERGRLLVARSKLSGAILGILYFGIVADYLTIYQIVVAKDYRRKGVASAMLKWVEGFKYSKHPKAKKYTLMKCKVRSDNESMDFWLASGWTPLCETMENNKRGDPLTYFWKRPGNQDESTQQNLFV